MTTPSTVNVARILFFKRARSAIMKVVVKPMFRLFLALRFLPDHEIIGIIEFAR